MSSLTEKNLKDIMLKKNPYFVPVVFYGFISLFRTKLEIPLKSFREDKSFGTKIITLRQCVNQLKSNLLNTLATVLL